MEDGVDHLHFGRVGLIKPGIEIVVILFSEWSRHDETVPVWLGIEFADRDRRLEQQA